MWNGQILAGRSPAAAPLISAEQIDIWRSGINEYSNETWSVFLELDFDITDSLSLERV